MRLVNLPSLTLVVIMLCCSTARAQKLLLYYDFEGDTATNIEDMSGYLDASGSAVSAHGMLIDPDGTPNNASIVADTVDPNGRGDVLRTGDSGYGATIPYSRKMDFRNSFTLSAWFRSADSLAIWQEIAGRENAGPRFFNHWGLGSVGGAEFYNTEFDIQFNFSSDPVQFVSPSGFIDGSQWHHLLLTWNAATLELWGYYDGFDGADPEDPGLSPVTTTGNILVAHPDEPFIIGEPRDNNQPMNTPFPEMFIDDVAFWQGYAPPSVAQAIYQGTISVLEVADLLEVPTHSADFDENMHVDGRDFLIWQSNFGLDDVTTEAVTINNGDANGDLKVDGFDLAKWQASYGTMLQPALVSIPEPSTTIIACGLAIAIGFRSRDLFAAVEKLCSISF